MLFFHIPVEIDLQSFKISLNGDVLFNCVVSPSIFSWVLCMSTVYKIAVLSNFFHNSTHSQIQDLFFSFYYCCVQSPFTVPSIYVWFSLTVGLPTVCVSRGRDSCFAHSLTSPYWQILGLLIITCMSVWCDTTAFLYMYNMCIPMYIGTRCWCRVYLSLSFTTSPPCILSFSAGKPSQPAFSGNLLSLIPHAEIIDGLPCLTCPYMGTGGQNFGPPGWDHWDSPHVLLRIICSHRQYLQNNTGYSFSHMYT